MSIEKCKPELVITLMRPIEVEIANSRIALEARRDAQVAA